MEASNKACSNFMNSGSSSHKEMQTYWSSSLNILKLRF
jgi:hypothetical protein